MTYSQLFDSLIPFLFNLIYFTTTYPYYVYNFVYIATTYINSIHLLFPNDFKLLLFNYFYIFFAFNLRI